MSTFGNPRTLVKPFAQIDFSPAAMRRVSFGTTILVPYDPPGPHAGEVYRMQPDALLGRSWQQPAASPGPPLGPASGDLGLNYPGPRVQGFYGRALDPTAPLIGQAYVWDGALWTPTLVLLSGLLSGDVTEPAPNVLQVVNLHVGNASNTQGDLAFRGAAVWEVLGAGLYGAHVRSNRTNAGPANPSYEYVPGALALYVDPATGSDTLNDGLTPGTALATLTEAWARCWGQHWQRSCVVTVLSALDLGANPTLEGPAGGGAGAALVAGVTPPLLTGVWLPSGLPTLTVSGATAGTLSATVYVPATVSTLTVVLGVNAWQHRSLRCVTSATPANVGRRFFVGSNDGSTFVLENAMVAPLAAFTVGDTFVVEVQPAVTFTGTLTGFANGVLGLRALSFEGPTVMLEDGKFAASGCRFKAPVGGPHRLRTRANVEFMGGGVDFYECFPPAIIPVDNGDSVNALGNGFASTGAQSAQWNAQDNSVQRHFGTNCVNPNLAQVGARMRCEQTTFDAADATSNQSRATDDGEHSEVSCRWIQPALGNNLVNPTVQADGGSTLLMSAVSFFDVNGAAVKVSNGSLATLGGLTGNTRNAVTACVQVADDSHVQYAGTNTIDNTATPGAQIELESTGAVSAAFLTAAGKLRADPGGSTATAGT